MECMEQVTAKSYYQAQRFRLTITPPEDDLSIVFDKTHLHSMIRNLLENAVKYSPADSIIEIEAEADQFIKLIITNESLVAIANPTELTGGFYHQHTYQEGFGLGLWIVDQLAALNQSSIQLLYEPPRFTAVLLLKKK